MAECHSGRTCPGSFVVAEYHPGTDLCLRPNLPRFCPWSGGDGRKCAVTEHHLRERSTGPGYALVVARCATHGHGFTIYPPGFAPFLRRPVLAVTPDGGALGAHATAPSLFAAAHDAAEGRAWRPRGAAYTTGRWRTQQRHIQITVKMLGLDPGAPGAVREQIAHHLAVPLLDLTSAPPQSAGFVARGRRVMEVFERLPRAVGLPGKLLCCGFVAGLWPAPVFV